jgi:hypothetical protein
MAHASCMPDKQGYTHARTRAPPRMHARFHTHTHTHTHTDKYVILTAFSRQLLRERALMVRYTYIACLVNVWSVMRFDVEYLNIGSVKT